MFNTQILAGSSGQGGETQQSLKFNDDESQYLSWTPAAAGNRRTFTLSVWVKRGNITASTIFSARVTSGTPATTFGFFNNDGNLNFQTNSSELTTNAIYRDPSSWYHIVLAVDTTQATSSNRAKLYVNGEQVTSFSSESYPTQNAETEINNSARTHMIGRNPNFRYFDGYMSDFYFIDGQALDPTSFGQFTNGYWEKKDYAGTYGQNGFHLTFQDDVVSEGFNVATWRGTGQSQAVSGLGFSPDLIWQKSRNASDQHFIVDSVRGVNQGLSSNSTAAEVTSGASNDMVSFDADGFTTGVPQNYSSAGSSGYNIVSWCWDAGSGSAASNTDGSITSTVKANPSYGFSIVSYAGNGTAGATIGHGLSSAPDMIIVKYRNAAPTNWVVYHSGVSTPQNNYATLNTTGAFTSNIALWNNTAPTSSVFSVGNAGDVNTSGGNFIAYCFAEVAGYSSIGSYSGTGAAGNAVTTGFAPAFVMIKRTDSTSNWSVFDNTRNVNGSAMIRANLSNAETDGDLYPYISFTSTGFTHLAYIDSNINVNGATYIYMAFADTREAAFWKDVSGNNNNWTPNNLDYRDSLIDSPANNFATFNSIHTDNTITLSEGNLKIVHGYDSGVGTTFGFNPSDATGYYAEFYKIVGTYGEIGIAPTNISDLSKPSTAGKNGYMLYLSSGQKANNGSYTAYGSNVAAEDIVSVAVKDGKIWWGVNGVWIAGGDPENGTNPAFSGISGEYFFIQAYDTNVGTALQTIANFGQDSTFAGARPAGGNQDDNGIGDFTYAPPSGYLALCTANLPTPSIVDGSEHFNTVLWASNGGVQSITSVGFQPELWWGKTRSSAGSHYVEDVVRGATNYLLTNSTNAEGTDTNYLTSFDADGFSMGSNQYANGTTMVAWNWKAGGTAVSNTAGSITSQVSANVDAGFSIVSYTGTGANATVGHSLGVQPSMIIAKRRDTAENWPVYTAFTGSSQYAYLDQTQAFGAATSVWQGVDPTSSVFSIGTSLTVNSSGGTYIAYCFANTEGYSKAGSYTGNGSTDGPFVYTGFRPAWIMWKRTDSSTGGEWVIQDTTRREFNPVNVSLYPNLSNAEGTGETFRVQDTLSNGFKLRSSAAQCNASGGTYIYLAFAETPFKYANAR
jgi:hypothetical protein